MQELWGFAPTDVLTQLPPLLRVLQQDTEGRSFWHSDVELHKSLLLLWQFSIGCRCVKQVGGDGFREKTVHCSATQTPMTVGTRGPGSYIHCNVAQITSAAGSSHSTTACNNQDNTDRERNELSHSRLHQAVELSAGSSSARHKYLAFSPPSLLCSNLEVGLEVKSPGISPPGG